MDTRKVDLHVHSTESDGTLTPKELAMEAKNQGLSAFALTDHDTVGGIKQARDAAGELGIELIPGVELSTEYRGKEVHMVGLFLDEDNPALLNHLASFRENRSSRNEKMYELLRQEGFDITEPALREMFPDAVLTRAHIARFLLEKGYVKDMHTVFDTYIGDGCRCYVPREKVTPMDGIRLIHAAGGKAVIAHPILYHMSDQTLRSLIVDCKEAGADGIEAIYSTYQPGDERYIRTLAKEYALLLSGGSDFHGSNKPMIKLGIGLGHLFVPYEILEKLREN
ncbi:MAG: PHP domain-containing protein [Roseburia sp.]|nr:PHP domain-containing protein [Roseburia sp.]